jgi:hypothetical protein
MFFLVFRVYNPLKNFFKPLGNKILISTLFCVFWYPHLKSGGNNFLGNFNPFMQILTAFAEKRNIFANLAKNKKLITLQMSIDLRLILGKILEILKLKPPLSQFPC